jgi:ABC-2 type transport system permease protein
MNLRPQFHFATALVGMNIKASWALRGTFLMKSFLMLGNNIVFFSVWWIYFHQFKTMKGWIVHDLEFVYGMAAAAFGVYVCFCNGSRLLGRYIVDGSLDRYLSQPKNPLLYAVGSHSNASGWGDIATGIFLFTLSGYGSLEKVPLIILMVLTGSLFFLATQVVCQSLAFWTGEIEALAQRMADFTITFSVYPNHIFPGWVRFLMFSIIPSGFISFMPVEIVRDFRWWKILALFTAAMAYSALAIWVFNQGLRRYESGNRIGIRS